jgi:hypothetical protein
MQNLMPQVRSRRCSTSRPPTALGLTVRQSILLRADEVIELSRLSVRLLSVSGDKGGSHFAAITSLPRFGGAANDAIRI